MAEEKKSGNKLWGGRFEQGISAVSEEISESISFDYQLYQYDIQASLAHAEMLARQNIIRVEEFEKIRSGLKQIQTEIEAGQMEFRYALEDIHTHIESRLVELIGADGKRLHTGRSRNDQVGVDTYLFLKANILQQREILLQLLSVILEKATRHRQDLWAGYTHTQIAQPVLLGHYLMAYFWMFYRDLNLLDFALSESDVSPLGSAALAGPNYPVDRALSANLLGFGAVSANSMDAVASRDYQLSYHFFASRFFIHGSRFCEDIILYNTAEFSYVKLADAVTTGSSIMPQKKNPDIAELLRGKSGRVIGNLQALLVNLKGLPMTYNRDLQEDKIYLFDSVKQVRLGILGLTEILNHASFFPDKVVANLQKGFAQATDIADYLVSHYQLPFREAHELTGNIVRYCEKQGKTLAELQADEIKTVLEGKYTLPAEVLSLEGCLGRKQGEGASSPVELEKQLAKARQLLASRQQA